MHFICHFHLGFSLFNNRLEKSRRRVFPSPPPPHSLSVIFAEQELGVAFSYAFLIFERWIVSCFQRDVCLSDFTQLPVTARQLPLYSYKPPSGNPSPLPLFIQQPHS